MQDQRSTSSSMRAHTPHKHHTPIKTLPTHPPSLHRHQPTRPPIPPSPSPTFNNRQRRHLLTRRNQGRPGPRIPTQPTTPPSLPQFFDFSLSLYVDLSLSTSPLSSFSFSLALPLYISLSLRVSPFTYFSVSLPLPSLCLSLLIPLPIPLTPSHPPQPKPSQFRISLFRPIVGRVRYM